VPTERQPDLSLFVDILHTLEAINAPYVIIGAFAATVYGITRTTYDIQGMFRTGFSAGPSPMSRFRIWSTAGIRRKI
jgi:hypothetical protein